MQRDQQVGRRQCRNSNCRTGVGHAATELVTSGPVVSPWVVRVGRVARELFVVSAMSEIVTCGGRHVSWTWLRDGQRRA